MTHKKKKRIDERADMLDKQFKKLLDRMVHRDILNHRPDRAVYINGRLTFMIKFEELCN
jgi:hypothetical protein